MSDHAMTDAVALIRAFEGDKHAFAEVLNGLDHVEMHRVIVQLAGLVTGAYRADPEARPLAHWLTLAAEVMRGDGAI